MAKDKASPNHLDEMDELSSLLSEIAAAMDLETALLIASARGGTQAYFTINPSHQNWLTKLVGHEKAKAIGAAIAPATGVRLEIPTGRAGFRKKINEARAISSKV